MSIPGHTFRYDVMPSQQLGGVLQSGALWCPRPLMCPRKGAVEFREALMIAMRYIPFVPAAPDSAGACPCKKAVYRRLGCVVNILLRSLRADVQEGINCGIHKAVGERVIGIELRLEGELRAGFQQRGEGRP